MLIHMLNIQNLLSIIQQLYICFRFKKSSQRYFNMLISQHMHIQFRSQERILQPLQDNLVKHIFDYSQ